MRTALVTLTAVAVVGTGVWLLGQHFGPIDPTPDVVVRCLVFGSYGALDLFVLIRLLQGRHETRTPQRVVAEDLRDRPRLTEEELGEQLLGPSTPSLTPRLRRILADGLDCDLAGMMPADDP